MILLGFEHNSPNGRYQPSNYHFDESMISSFDSYKKLIYESSVIKKTDSPPEIFRNFICRNVDIITDIPYIYLIPIFNIKYFLQFHSHISINPKTLNDINNGTAILVFDYMNEGDLYDHIESFSKLVKELKLPEKSVFVMHGDFSIEKYNNLGFTYIPMCVYDYSMSPFTTYHSSTYNLEYKPEKLYLSYNRQPRTHRLLMLAELYKSRLLDHGKISFKKIPEYINFQNILNFNENIANGLTNVDINYLQNYISILDIDNLVDNNPAINIFHDHYTTTFMSLVTETSIKNNNLFVSEKIFKPILVEHPFVVLGSPNYLKLLHSFGYKTFSNWIDESYDSEINLEKRISMICNQLKRFSQLTATQLSTIRTEMKEVTSHNRNKLIDYWKTYRYGSNTPLRHHLENLYTKSFTKQIPRCVYIDDLNNISNTVVFLKKLNNSNTLCIKLHPKTINKNISSIPHEALVNFINNQCNQNSILVLDWAYEGFVNSVIDVVHSILDKICVKAENIYYITAALNGVEKYQDYCSRNNITQKINFYATNSWEVASCGRFVIKDCQLPNSYNIRNNKKLFLCFNRVCRMHRIALIGLLYESDLITNSYTSFFPHGAHQKTEYSKFSIIFGALSRYVSSDFFNRIKISYEKNSHNFPLKLNIDDTENANYLKSTDLEYYENTYFSLVTETYFFDVMVDGHIEQDAIFFSEKIFKPMLMLHPFILVCKPHSLAWLKKLGYQTFHPYIDESYDRIENHEDRLLAIMAEVKRLSKFSESEWHQWQNNIKDIVIHNQKVLLGKTKMFWNN